MGSILLPDPLYLTRLRPTTSATSNTTAYALQAPCLLLSHPGRTLFSIYSTSFHGISALHRSSSLVSASDTLSAGVYTVGDFMTRKEDLHVVRPTTSVDEALEILVERRITGFPVIDDDWKLVGLVSDYDLLALDSISGGGRADNSMFPEVDSTWKKLLSKTNGKVIGDLMTPAPVVVRETTNLEDAARLLLETKHRRLPVVDANGKLVGIITRGNVVRAALHLKRDLEKKAP
ncbi:CBS domain-containing protein CBSX1, chloroplastic-like isoform X6 [Mangifera indica]|uniref:CBS domain-containing protein CBSX1, chloroplastic-like isoform X6 n=1 Tax=Mangifera indica TaxID=29780 RepID=UPI001CF94990|nr:CBS domain-containing protein CBSX1, chloroplastic-like isoform X6 [Mangifera indica]